MKYILRNSTCISHIYPQVNVEKFKFDAAARMLESATKDADEDELATFPAGRTRDACGRNGHQLPAIRTKRRRR
jgi:hypothetical protein